MKQPYRRASKLKRLVQNAPERIGKYVDEFFGSMLARGCLTDIMVIMLILAVVMSSSRTVTQFLILSVRAVFWSVFGG